jgi:hypothetical protein
MLYAHTILLAQSSAGSASGVRVLALVGLLVGLLMLVLPGAPVVWPLPDTSCESLALGDDGPDDDPSLPLVMLTAEAPCLTPATAVGSVDGLLYAYLWPFHYLTRPQLLTR